MVKSIIIYVWACKIICVTKYSRVRLVTSCRESETSTKIKLACFK